MLFRLKLRSRFSDAPPTSGVRAVTAVMNPIVFKKSAINTKTIYGCKRFLKFQTCYNILKGVSKYKFTVE